VNEHIHRLIRKEKGREKIDKQRQIDKGKPKFKKRNGKIV
jgi:hypothetical protein